MPPDDTRARDPTASSSVGASPSATDLLEQLRQATLGEYDIHSEVARGGMAAVYLAHDIALGRKVAIKLMSPGLVFGPGMVERFKREARTAASLSHPNIIPVYTVREVNGLCFFVMKLVQGTTLDAALRQVGQAPIAMVEAVLAQAGSALGYAHRNGVVHRDVKPGNIMIDDEGWVVVTDFGIAKVADAEGLTLTGMSVGTPAYMSPEQCVGAEVTAASDQYSLGAIAYEMLAGRRPFAGSTAVALMYAHAHTDPTPLAELRPDCPEQLRETVTRMLRKDPAARWPSLEEAVKALGGPTFQPDDATRSRLVELARTASVANLVARAQTPRSPVPVTRTRERPVAAVAPPPRRWPRAAMVVGGIALGVAAGYLLLRDAPAPPPESRSQAAIAAETPVASADSAQDGTAAAPRAGAAATASLPPVGAAAPAPPPPAAVSPQVRSVTVAVGSSPQATKAADPPAPPTLPASTESADVVRPTPTTIVPPPALAPAPAAAPTVSDPRQEIVATIQRYADALETGDIARVRQAYPGMTAEQRDGLVAFYSAGGALKTQWSIQDVIVAGPVATARVLGTNRVTVPRGRPSEQSVNLSVRLERQGSGWRLASVAN